MKIDTALKQLDVTLKQVRRIQYELPKLKRENVNQHLKILKLDLQLLQQDLVAMKKTKGKDAFE